MHSIMLTCVVFWSCALSHVWPADKVSAEGRVTMVRAISCVAFSEDREVMYAGTTTGDFAVVVTKDRKLRRTITACRSGVLSLLVWDDVVLVGGGDGTVSLFDQSLVRQCHVDVSGGVKAMSLSPDRQEVVVGTGNGLVYRVRVEARAKRMSALVVCENHAGPVRSIQYAKVRHPRGSDILDLWWWTVTRSSLSLRSSHDYSPSSSALSFAGPSPDSYFGLYLLSRRPLTASPASRTTAACGCGTRRTTA